MAGRRTRILIRRSSRIALLGVFFILGIGLPQWIPHASTICILGSTIACTLIILTYWKERGLFPWIICACLLAFIGSARTLYAVRVFQSAPQTYTFSGNATVLRWRERIFDTFSYGTVTATTTGTFQYPVAITVPRTPSYQPGTGITFSCTLTKVPMQETVRGQWYTCKKPHDLIPHPKTNIHTLRYLNLPISTLDRAITRVIPEPAGSFTAGILLGIDDRIRPNTKQAFRNTGTAHIFALSGFNITLITASLGIILAYGIANQNIRLALTVGLVGMFVLATGGESSSIRAGIMGATVLTAHHVGRIARARILLPLTASAMLLHTPLILRYDIGFQLSFLAATGIMMLGAPIARRLTRIPTLLGIRETAAATIAALIATAPILVSLGNNIGPKTILANILIGPLIPIAMASGFFGTIIGSIAPPIAPLVGTIAGIPAQTIIDCADIIAHL